MDYLPPRDLEDFIVSEVLRQEIEKLLEDGQRFDVATIFVAGSQRHPGRSLGTASRATPATLTIRCRSSEIAGWIELQCDFASDPTPASPTGVSWRLVASIRKDDRGYYLTRRQFMAGMP